MTGPVTSALVAASVAIAIFFSGQYINLRSQKRVAQRDEFERFINEARDYTIDAILSEDADLSHRSIRLLLYPRLTMKLSLPPSSDETLFWVELIVERIVQLAQLTTTSEAEKYARSNQLDSTLELLSTTLTEIHRGTYDNLDTTESFIGLLREAEEREHLTLPGEPEWWAQDVPDWLKAPPPRGRIALARAKFRREFGRRFRPRRLQETLNKLQELHDNYVASLDNLDAAITRQEKAIREAEQATGLSKEELLEISESSANSNREANEK